MRNLKIIFNIHFICLFFCMALFASHEEDPTTTLISKGGHGGHHHGHHGGHHRHHRHHRNHHHAHHHRHPWWHHNGHPNWHHRGWHHGLHDWYWYGAGENGNIGYPGYYYDPNFNYYETGTPSIEYEYDENPEEAILTPPNEINPATENPLEDNDDEEDEEEDEDEKESDEKPSPSPAPQSSKTKTAPATQNLNKMNTP